MGAEIDRLDIAIETQATKAVAALDTLIKKLDGVSASIGKINGSNLAGFANGIEQISKASAGLSGVNANSFQHLANGIKAISGIPTSNMLKTAQNIRVLASGMNQLGAVSQNAKDLGSVANNISKLGGKNIDKAIANMPRISKALNEMMSTLSKAPAVSGNLIQMTNAIANLASQGARAGSIPSADSGDATKKTSLLSRAFNTLTSSIGRSRKGFRSFSQIAGSFYANFFLIIRGVKEAWKVVESSMDFLETVNYFEVAMRKLGDDAASNWQQAGYDSAESYANSFSDRAKQLTAKMTGYEIDSDGNATYTGKKNLGMNPNTVMNYQAMFAQVSESIGVAEESALNFSNALTMLGTDWASLRNTTFEQSFEKFASALAGQSRAVRAFGIDITNATLQEYAYKYGLSTAVSEMNQATKAQLRLLAMLDQSKVAFGDLANTMNSPSNQLRMLQQNFANLARTIGNLFLPIVEKVLPYINGLVMALQQLFAWIGSLLGIEFKSINSSMGGADNGMENFVSDTEDAGDALKEADKAAKKLKNTVLGFDELNQLNDNSDSSGSKDGDDKSGTGGSPILDEAIAKALEEYQKAWDEAFARMDNKAQEVADRICDAFKKGDYKGIGTYISNGITNALESIQWDKVYKVASNFGTGLAEFLNGLITPELFSAVGGTIAGALNTAIYTALSFGETFDWTNLGESIAAGINRFFKDFDFKALAETINVWVQGLFKTLKTAVANIDWWEVFKGINDFFKNLDISTVAIVIGALTIKKILGLHLAKTALGMIGSEISKSIAAALAPKLGIELAKGAGLSSLFLKFGKNMGTTFVAGFKALFGSKAAESALAFINPVVSKITGIGSVISGAVTAVVNFFAMWKDGFSWLNEALMILGTAITAIGAVILGIGAAPAAIVAAVVAAAATVAIVIKDHWTEICTFFSGLGKWFDKNVISPIVEFFRGLWETVSGFFQDLWDDISEIWQTASDWFSETVIEPIVSFFQGFQKRVKQVFQGLWIIVQAIWKIASGWFSENVTTPITKLFNTLKTKISGFFSTCWNAIKTVWTVVSGWFSENVTTPVKNLFSTVKTSISNAFKKAWGVVKGAWEKASTWFRDNIATPLGNVFDNIKEKITGAFDSAWTAVKKGVVGAMNAVIAGIESAINWIVNGINKIIGGFNKVVSWAAKVAEVDWGGVDLVPTVSLGRISMYANGGFPETGELFMARENGINEMVGKIGNRSTVANNDQIVEAVSAGVADGVMQAMMAVMGGSRQNQAPVIENVFKVDSETLYRMTLKGKEKHNSRYHVVTEF
jgi:phage-related protein|nr:MAG TPA: minor tail protein [Caudoviricetes sp.]